MSNTTSNQILTAPIRMYTVPLIVGATMVACGLFAALRWLPEHDLDRVVEKLSDPNAVGPVLWGILGGQRYLHPDDLAILYPAAWIAVGLGAALLLFRGVRRAPVRYCPNCEGFVVGIPASGLLRYRCERCRGRVQKKKPEEVQV
jgi:hypothetical protein